MPETVNTFKIGTDKKWTSAIHLNRPVYY